jgi:antitoxin HigA-1
MRLSFRSTGAAPKPTGGPEARPAGTAWHLREESTEPLALSANALARALALPPNRITHIIYEERSVTADAAIRLGRYFGTPPQFRLNLQTDYEPKAFKEREAEINDRVHPRAAPRWQRSTPMGNPEIRQ